MLYCKDSVRFKILRPYVYELFTRLNEIFREYALDCIITCGTEAHKDDDPHTHGFAVDIRSKHIPDTETKHAILAKLRASCGQLYTVLLENEGDDNEHFHCQVKKDLWRSLK